MNISSGVRLYPFQVKHGLDKIIDSFQNNNKVILSWYTGAGKTNVFLELCRKLIAQNPKVKIGISSYFTTEIREQLITRIIDVGLGKYAQNINSSSIIDDDKNIFVFIPQAIRMNLPDIKFDYFIIDEAHFGTGDRNYIINHIIKGCADKNTKFLGCSATPWDALAQKLFKESLVLKRTIQDGLKDGIIADIEIKTEECQIEFSDDDFSRTGDLSARNKNLSVLRSVCFGKFKNLLNKYDDKIGEKCIVICPPGNSGEIARGLAAKYGELCSVGYRGVNISEYIDSIEEFKSNPKKRFLFVIYKCGIGFDYPGLTSVIDLTMSRNLTSLVQRIGRLSRKKGNLKKTYFYVYDKGLRSRVDWLIMSCIDVSVGDVSGWSTKTFKYRPVSASAHYLGKDSRTISEIIEALDTKNSFKNVVTLKYTESVAPKNRNLKDALVEVSKYRNRNDLYKADPALYKWLRENAPKDAFQKALPAKIFKTWTVEKAIEAMKKCRSRVEFNKLFGGCDDWLRSQNLDYLRDKYLPPPKNKTPTEKEILNKLKTCRTWGEVRKKYPSLRHYIVKKGLNEKYKSIFENVLKRKL